MSKKIIWIIALFISLGDKTSRKGYLNGDLHNDWLLVHKSGARVSQYL